MFGPVNYAKFAGALSLGFVGYLLSFDSTIIAPVSFGNAVRLSLLALIALGWVLAARALAHPTAAEIATEKANLAKAIAIDGGQSGVTQEWYSSAEARLESTRNFLGTGVGLLVILAVGKAWPHAAFAQTAEAVHHIWVDLLDSYTPFELYVGGIFLCFIIPYYSMTIVFAILDFSRPTFLEPFKIQQDYHLTWADFLKCFSLSLLNQVIMFGFLILTWPLYSKFAPDAFSPELPGLLTFVISIMCFLPIADIFFYFPHAWMHKSTWAYEHIHSIHHSWIAPIAASAIYAHPVEFILGNLPVVAAGPILLGVHISIFYVWAFAAVVDTSLNHSGWQLPFLPANQSHDYHHSTFVPEDGPQNIGVVGVMDHLLGTDRGFNKSWQAGVNKSYSSPDYPVDKIILKAGKGLVSDTV